MSDTQVPAWIQDNASWMRQELESQRLVVVLVPAPFGGPDRKFRMVESRNPAWYRDFCAHFEAGRSRPRTGRKPDTLIKRQHTLRALKEIEEGAARTEYAERLLPWVEQYRVEVELGVSPLQGAIGAARSLIEMDSWLAENLE